MTGNILGENIDEIYLNQIKTRQEIAGAGYNENPLVRDNNVINYLNNRNSWVKLASGVEITSKAEKKLKDLVSTSGYTSTFDIEQFKGLKLAKNFVLFNTTQKVIPGYDKTTSGEGDDTIVEKIPTIYDSRSGVATSKSNLFNNSLYGGIGITRGLQPVPGIIDVNVDCVNRGSIKKATVTLKAYNKFQFGIIELLYLRLGYVMLLEYGWDRYAEGISDSGANIADTETTLLEDLWFTEGKSYQQKEILAAIEAKRKAYQGNYDGFFGKVTNFSWDLQSDGTYDITINLLTLGSVITSLRANIPSSGISETIKRNINSQILSKEGVDLTSEEGIKKIRNTANLGSDLISIDLNITKADFPYSNQNYLYLPNLGGSFAASGSAEYETNYVRNKLGKNYDNRHFIALGEFLTDFFDIVNKEVKNGSTKSTPQIQFVASDEIKCNYELNSIPFDPRVCIYKPVFTEQIVDGAFTTGDTTYQMLTKFDGKKDFVKKESGGVYYGNLMNLYMNFTFLLKCVSTNTDSEGNISIFGFLQNLCNGINRSMAGVTKLEPIVTDDINFNILEQNQPKGSDNKKSSESKDPTFEIFGFNPNSNQSNFVKDFNFQTKISPDLVNIISIGAAASNSDTNNLTALPFNKWNEGLKNRFEEKYIKNNRSKTIKADAEETAETDDVALKNEAFNKLKETLKVGGTTNGGVKFSFTDPKGKQHKNVTIPGISWITKLTANLDTRFQNSPTVTEYSKTPSEYITKYETQLKDYAYKMTKESVAQLTPVDYDVVLSSNAAINDYFNYLIRAFGGFLESFSFAGVNGDIKQRDSINPDGAQYWEINNDFIKQGISSFKAFLSERDKLSYEEDGIVSNNTGFIPLQLGLTIDGLSGINIYNRINIDQAFLPSNYPDSLKFVITKVDHNISNNLWTTTLETLSLPKLDKAPKERKYKKNDAPQGENIDGVYIKEYTAGVNQGQFPITSLKGTNPTRVSMINNNSPSGLLYYPEVSEKKTIILHHTAGNYGAETCAQIWGMTEPNSKTPVRKRKDDQGNYKAVVKYPLCTHYVITRDGGYEQMFEDEYWSNNTGAGRDTSKPSLSMELECLGYLKKKSGTYLDKTATYYSPGLGVTRTDEKWGGVSRPVKLVDKGQHDYKSSSGRYYKYISYRGYSYYQRYPQKQLERMGIVIAAWSDKFSIPLAPKDFFTGGGKLRPAAKQWYEDMFPKKNKKSKNARNNVKGIYTHNSYIGSGKYDVYPSIQLIETIINFSQNRKTQYPE